MKAEWGVIPAGEPPAARNPNPLSPVRPQAGAKAAISFGKSRYKLNHPSGRFAVF
jgi:hypothetical protein